MERTSSASPIKLRETVITIVNSTDYSANFQPSYQNSEQLIEAVAEIQNTETITTPDRVESLKQQIGAIATGQEHRPIIITGSCAEPIIPIDLSLQPLVQDTLQSLEIVSRSDLIRPLHIRRERGQNTKPRSQEFEKLPDGREVLSYMGDAINSSDPNQREADPSRLVSAAIQARDLGQILLKTHRSHIPAAHEALSLPYEVGFMHTEENSGKQYLLSADLPWIGVRTNSPDGMHVNLLSSVENPLGVKLDHTTTPEHIAGLQQKLNPNNEAGKLSLMLRLGLKNMSQAPKILEAIKQHAPESIIMADIHGATRKLPTGQKTRVVPEFIQEIKELNEVCKLKGLKLHGLHLETTSDSSRLECVNTPDQEPTHPGVIDPRLNPRQTSLVLNEFAAAHKG